MTALAVRRVLALGLAVASLTLTACGGSDADLTVYSGRNEKLVGPLFERFEKATGLDVEVRYADSAELAATLAEEGDNSPADVFFAQDAGSLGAVEGRLAPLPAAVVRPVDRRFRDPRGRWVGASARARVVAYSTSKLREDELPDSIFDFVRPEWKGRIGFPPPNASFQAFVSAMRLDVGDARTRRWLEAIKANAPKLYDNNIQTVEAIDRGEIDVGFVNHYYLYELRRERPEIKVANHFLRAGDPGSLVNVAGAGVLRSADHAPEAQRFVRFLLGLEGQRFFAQETFEYPLIAGTAPPRGLPALRSVTGPDITLARLGAQLKATLALLDEVGLTS